MNVLDEENVDRRDTREGGQLSPRRPQPCDPPAAAPGGHDELLALPRGQRGQLFDERRVTRPVEEEIIDPACERPTDAPRVLLRPRGESQATCRGAVEGREAAVGGGLEGPHGTDVVAAPAHASTARIGAGDGYCPWSGPLPSGLPNRSFRHDPTTNPARAAPNFRGPAWGLLVERVGPSPAAPGGYLRGPPPSGTLATLDPRTFPYPRPGIGVVRRRAGRGR